MYWQYLIFVFTILSIHLLNNYTFGSKNQLKCAKIWLSILSLSGCTLYSSNVVVRLASKDVNCIKQLFCHSQQVRSLRRRSRYSRSQIAATHNHSNTRIKLTAMKAARTDATTTRHNPTPTNPVQRINVVYGRETSARFTPGAQDSSWCTPSVGRVSF